MLAEELRLELEDEDPRRVVEVEPEGVVVLMRVSEEPLLLTRLLTVVLLPLEAELLLDVETALLEDADELLEVEAELLEDAAVLEEDELLEVEAELLEEDELDAAGFVAVEEDVLLEVDTPEAVLELLDGATLLLVPDVEREDEEALRAIEDASRALLVVVVRDVVCAAWISRTSLAFTMRPPAFAGASEAVRLVKDFSGWIST